jgi:hypothetical protein
MKKLSGWADDLSSCHRKIMFPLQMAMYEVIGDCDWKFKITTVGSDVRYEWTINVVAERCCAVGYDKTRRVERTFQRYEFSFKCKPYTLLNVYECAKKELECL